MISDERQDKVKRILYIYSKLMDGGVISKREEADRFGVTERSIQRDIDDIRSYFGYLITEEGEQYDIAYSRADNGFRLKQISQMKLSNGEVLAICKILLDSRAFPKKDMHKMLHKLIECAVPETDRKKVWELIKNEEYHYVELKHKKPLIDQLWTLGQAIMGNNYIEIEYTRLKERKTVHRKLRPMALMFSEYYFYLTAFIDEEETRKDFDEPNDPFPTIYRVDRIKSINVLKDRFVSPYPNRFEEGEFRKRVQFMYGGKLNRVTFTYSGPDIDSVLDRLPTARILSEDDGIYTVTAEVFGSGIDMWFRSQGDMIKLY